jgi:signal transduction histidine kinase
VIQVFVNLLSNAIKFSPAHATVGVRIHRMSDHARISIKDHGDGIPDEFRRRIFQKFAQADSSDTRHKDGTGLGLNICKSIIDGHGGRIDFRSEAGTGTEFYMDLPAAVLDQ